MKLFQLTVLVFVLLMSLFGCKTIVTEECHLELDFLINNKDTPAACEIFGAVNEFVPEIMESVKEGQKVIIDVINADLNSNYNYQIGNQKGKLTNGKAEIVMDKLKGLNRFVVSSNDNILSKWVYIKANLTKLDEDNIDYVDEDSITNKPPQPIGIPPNPDPQPTPSLVSIKSELTGIRINILNLIRTKDLGSAFASFNGRLSEIDKLVNNQSVGINGLLSAKTKYSNLENEIRSYEPPDIDKLRQEITNIRLSIVSLMESKNLGSAFDTYNQKLSSIDKKNNSSGSDFSFLRNVKEEYRSLEKKISDHEEEETKKEDLLNYNAYRIAIEDCDGAYVSRKSFTLSIDPFQDLELQSLIVVGNGNGEMDISLISEGRVLAKTTRNKIIKAQSEIDLSRLDYRLLRGYSYTLKFEFPSDAVPLKNLSACTNLRGQHMKLSSGQTDFFIQKIVYKY